MPNLKLTDLASLKAYFTAIAASHVSIGGFKFGSLDVVKNDNRSNITDSFLWVQPYDQVRYTAVHNDNKQKLKTARVGYFKVRDSELFADEDADFEFCESVIEDIIAKMDVDKRGSLVGSNWEMVALNMASIVTRPVEETIGSTKYIGWEMSIEFVDNTKLAYNAAKWE